MVNEYYYNHFLRVKNLLSKIDDGKNICIPREELVRQIDYYYKMSGFEKEKSIDFLVKSLRFSKEQTKSFNEGGLLKFNKNNLYELLTIRENFKNINNKYKNISE